LYFNILVALNGKFCRGLESRKTLPKFSAAGRPFGPVRASADVRRTARTHVAQMEDVAMRTYDFTPLWRSTVGFDHLFDLINNSQGLEGQDTYPAYDITRTGEETYRISLALAGFSVDDIIITAQQNLLTVAGRHPEDHGQEFIYQGISARAFERRFSLADHVEVEHAVFENGLLRIDLVRKVPEAMKPRRIDIAGEHVTDRSNKAKTAIKAA
jgi:molecular chaperone IbpA